MKMLADCLDSLIHAIQIVTKTVAYLLGIHLFVLLHFARILTTDRIGALRRQTAASGTQLRRTTTTTAARVGGAQTGFPFHPHLRHNLRPLHPRLLRLPSLEPRPCDDPVEQIAVGVVEYIFGWLGLLSHKMKEEVIELADQIESRGGKTGAVVTHFRRRSEAHVDPVLLQRLPPEILTHILLLAAASDAVPTKICLLSKAHHRLVVPRLYAAVDLSAPRIFRQFRLTLALYNPGLGQHLRSLSVGSSTFDSYGYMPSGIAESAALGVGLEQILLAAPRLKHIYLDLFSLAALHDGTGSRLQKGSLPISLTTEYAAPQYLALPIFSHLQHVELTVFGLDRVAGEKLRQALPQVKSMTLRWVTRQSEAFDDTGDASWTGQTVRVPYRRRDTDSSSSSGEEGEDDMTESERQAWRRGGQQSCDFALFVDAVEALRMPPVDSEEQGTCERLEAITVLAWPKAHRELCHYFRADTEAVRLQECMGEGLHGDDAAWDKSLGKQDDTVFVKPRFDRPARRIAGQSHRAPVPTPTSAAAAISSPVAPPPTTLRLAMDPTYRLGPRRGPLESWSSAKGSAW